MKQPLPNREGLFQLRNIRGKRRVEENEFCVEGNERGSSPPSIIHFQDKAIENFDTTYGAAYQNRTGTIAVEERCSTIKLMLQMAGTL